MAEASTDYGSRTQQRFGSLPESMADRLSRLRKRHPRPQDWDEDMARGLQVINSRTDSLTRFTGGLARLARLPEHEAVQPVDLSCLDRIRGFATARESAGGVKSQEAPSLCSMPIRTSSSSC